MNVKELKQLLIWVDDDTQIKLVYGDSNGYRVEIGCENIHIETSKDKLTNRDFCNIVIMNDVEKNTITSDSCSNESRTFCGGSDQDCCC